MLADDQLPRCLCGSDTGNIQRSILLARDPALVAQRCRLAMLSDAC